MQGVNTSDHEYDEIVTDIAHSKKRQHSEVEEGSGDSDARLSKTKVCYLENANQPCFKGLTQ